MHPKTEELLYLLLWSAEQLTQPTFRNLTDSFESWAYRNGLLRQLAELERKKLIERKTGDSDARVYRLTAQGCQHALGGRNPPAQWSRKWDGRWRLVLFDLPVEKNAQRLRLRRYLLARGFGYLQNSVWITPDALHEQIDLLRGAKIDVESLVLLEARPCAGESDAQIVAGAWDFPRINRRFEQHMKILANKPGGTLRTETQARALRQWAAAERAAWLKATRRDPLLPENLLPLGYLGQRAWQQRVEVFRRTRRELDTFKA